MRKWIVLHYFHDWRIAEVADHLGRTAEAASGLSIAR